MDKYEPKLGIKRLNPNEKQNKEVFITLFCLHRDGYIPPEIIFETFEIDNTEDAIKLATDVSLNDFTVNSIKTTKENKVEIGIGLTNESSNAAKLVQSWAENFLKLLDERKCENYCEMTLICTKTDRQVIVTILHENGKTPHQFRKELDLENFKLKTNLEILEAENALLKIQLNNALKSFQKE